ncbi:MAG: uroporphyrinogen-III C-methyltransferase [Candidatus Latescibacterota bacterium]
MTKAGYVSLVGAGPGDPGLITLRGVEALKKADVVLYDRLVTKEILQYAKPDAEMVYVGKGCGNHSMPQDDINRLLIEYAQRGNHVVRLKSGDPYVFGRGGEETEELEKAGIPYEVIPGITAAIAAGAYCGLPLTKRGVSSCLTLVTGHEDPTKDHSDVNWAALAQSKGTIVIYMAMAHLDRLVSKLIASGFAADTPGAVISNATTPQQKTITGKLQDLAKLAKEHNLAPPSVIVIGEVVQIRQ